MKILQFQQQGRRTHQEDFLLLNEAAGLFLVCDGVGGSAKGEVASSLVAHTIAGQVEKAGQATTDVSAVHQFVKEAQYALQTRLADHPEEAGMGTTLAMLRIQDGKAVVAHVGDSRVYYVKPGKGLYWRTNDHSHVQMLFDTGVLKSEEEMDRHPMRNIISRALQAKADETMVEPDVAVVQNLQPGDLFLLCSDGVLEPYTPTDFIALLGNKDLKPEEKKAALEAACAAESRDNNTCILLEIGAEDVAQNAGENTGLTMRAIPSMLALNDEEHALGAPEEVSRPSASAASETPDAKEPHNRGKNQPLLNRTQLLLLAGILLMIVVLAVIYQIPDTNLAEAESAAGKTDQKPDNEVHSLQEDNATNHRAIEPEANTRSASPTAKANSPVLSENGAEGKPKDDVPPASTEVSTPNGSDHRKALEKLMKNKETALKEKLAGQYAELGSLAENRMAVKDASSNWGYVNEHGALVIKHQFKMANAFSNGRAMVIDDKGNRFTIDNTGTCRENCPTQ
ncbi:MAG: protein phosphatase 2C domain-containing protein [Saprospiraceae bacterium]|nr:protein phosphatase 2C domain-containing protein [Saprospiraceae bacterium]